jgi:GNAT superfamily N-acetyltransferase
MTDFVFRPATWDDLDGFYRLYGAEHIESYGSFGMAKEECAAEWAYPNFDLAQHTQYAFTPEGRMLAYGELRVWRDVPVRPILYAYVDADYRGQGIGTQITQWAIKQAEVFLPHVPEEARVVLGAFSNRANGQRLLEDQGFVCTRQSHIMGIDLHDALPQPEFPPEFRLLTMAEHPLLEDFVRVYQATFRDHRGAVEESLDAAVARWETILKSGAFRPEHFVLVKEGDADAAVLMLSERSDEDADKAWVQTIGTMPNYRRRGLATQLLYLAFQFGRDMGKARVGLSVDASSLTGAEKLYAKVGMTVDMVYNAYELEIRPGVELTRQG